MLALARVCFVTADAALQTPDLGGEATTRKVTDATIASDNA